MRFAHQDAAHVAPERCHVRQRRERHVELDYHELVRADSLVQVAVRRCLVKLIVAWPCSLLLSVRCCLGSVGSLVRFAVHSSRRCVCLW